MCERGGQLILKWVRAQLQDLSFSPDGRLVWEKCEHGGLLRFLSGYKHTHL